MIKGYVIGKSVQGASHKHVDKECQDNNKFLILDDGTCIMAVADGHGSDSCPYSKTGSQTAVNVFCKVLNEYRDNFLEHTDQLMTFLNREGDTKVAQTICNEWKNRILRIHRMLKRDFPVDENGEKDEKAVLRQYGTTLIGLMICDEFLFAFQIGDGDIVHVDDNSVEHLIQGEHILGIETHSLSRDKAWEKAFTVVRRIDTIQYPCAFMLSTDGFANSYPTAEAFQNACGEYYQMLKEHGPEAIQANLDDWLDETSRLGCGDDITWLCTLLEESEEDKDDINVGDE